jgi:hypothetical protein
MATGMGAGPITWQELAAWSDRMSLELQPWESLWLVRLSREYAAEQSMSSDEDRAPPWAGTWPARAKREATDKAVRVALSAAANTPAPAAQRKRRKS